MHVAPAVRGEKRMKICYVDTDAGIMADTEIVCCDTLGYWKPLGKRS